MNVAHDLLHLLQTFASAVPDPLQPVIIALLGAIPFVDGELASVIGVASGLHPVVVGVAAAAGNFLCVAVIVLLGDRLRRALVRRRGAAAGGARPAKPQSKGRQRFTTYLVRFGVPGACLLGPLALPGQLTAGIMIGAGVNRGWLLLWQGVSIVLWTGAVTLLAVGAVGLTRG